MKMIFALAVTTLMSAILMFYMVANSFEESTSDNETELHLEVSDVSSH